MSRFCLGNALEEVECVDWSIFVYPHLSLLEPTYASWLFLRVHVRTHYVTYLAITICLSESEEFNALKIIEYIKVWPEQWKWRDSMSWVIAHLVLILPSLIFICAHLYEKIEPLLWSERVKCFQKELNTVKIWFSKWDIDLVEQSCRSRQEHTCAW